MNAQMAVVGVALAAGAAGVAYALGYFGGFGPIGGSSSLAQRLQKEYADRARKAMDCQENQTHERALHLNAQFQKDLANKPGLTAADRAQVLQYVWVVMQNIVRPPDYPNNKVPKKCNRADGSYVMQVASSESTRIIADLKAREKTSTASTQQIVGELIAKLRIKLSHDSRLYPTDREIVVTDAQAAVRIFLKRREEDRRDAEYERQFQAQETATEKALSKKYVKMLQDRTKTATDDADIAATLESVKSDARKEITTVARNPEEAQAIQGYVFGDVDYAVRAIYREAAKRRENAAYEQHRRRLKADVSNAQDAAMAYILSMMHQERAAGKSLDEIRQDVSDAFDQLSNISAVPVRHDPAVEEQFSKWAAEDREAYFSKMEDVPKLVPVMMQYPAAAVKAHLAYYLGDTFRQTYQLGSKPSAPPPPLAGIPRTQTTELRMAMVYLSVSVDQSDRNVPASHRKWAHGVIGSYTR